MEGRRTKPIRQGILFLLVLVLLFSVACDKTDHTKDSGISDSEEASSYFESAITSEVVSSEEDTLVDATVTETESSSVPTSVPLFTLEIPLEKEMILTYLPGIEETKFGDLLRLGEISLIVKEQVKEGEGFQGSLGICYSTVLFPVQKELISWFCLNDKLYINSVSALDFVNTFLGKEKVDELFSSMEWDIVWEDLTEYAKVELSQELFQKLFPIDLFLDEKSAEWLKRVFETFLASAEKTSLEQGYELQFSGKNMTLLFEAFILETDNTDLSRFTENLITYEKGLLELAEKINGDAENLALTLWEQELKKQNELFLSRVETWKELLALAREELQGENREQIHEALLSEFSKDWKMILIISETKTGIWTAPDGDYKQLSIGS